MTRFFWLKIGVVFLVLQASCSGSADVPYNVSDDGDDTNLALTVSECEEQEFLTTDCADVIAEENERKKEEQAAVVAAKTNLNDFADCQSFEADAEGDDSANTACADVVAFVLDGFDACKALAQSEKYYECSEIEADVNAAVALCDASDPSVTTDFCALVNPTTDEDAQ